MSTKMIVTWGLMLIIFFFMLTLPLMSLTTTLNLSEIGRMVDTSQSIVDNLETACINALENNVDYSAKTRGVVVLKENHTVVSDAISEMERVLKSYNDNGNFESPPAINVTVTSVGGKTEVDDEGRFSNFGDLGQDVTQEGFTGQFPALRADITYKFQSILAGVERAEQGHTINVELNHTNIITNDW